ncbi:MAG: restriction endonuclease [Leptolyngbya sp. UWPOB_LEPTO1]|uniref:Eco57I restriction-modification methylase domain-containing protein n=1 Tax=Leptolyngbya sp. UWPOB_LEPTO1 TaxID=2815653 RepID=UPI001ACF6F2C|nr:DNA methyltransferase [Leptolyngbya sp. UWPOB_LEPTO1]MBN8564087.1 restriction endonuclease [Leptolyngbya sp. UWPOB_LEPTO1]
MSTARHHAEWLSLVEASGPFLSLPVLLKTFPAGLDAHDPEHLKLLRSASEEWQDNQFGLKPEPAIHRAWVEFVLKQTLELPDEVLLSGQQIPSGLSVAFAEQNETIRPDWVVVEPTGTPNAGKPRLLVQMVPAAQGLEKPLKGSRSSSSPATRMMELLHACNVRLGLVTNGEHWMLVNAPKGETTGFISWYSTLWIEEHLTLRAFRSLLGVRRFFAVDDSQILEKLLADSLTDQQEVTDQLGYQVRRAVEVLVSAIARLDQDQNGALLKDISESQLYESALTVMMRLVFLFCAEERGLLLLGDPIYDQHYAVSTLREQLRSHADQYGEEVLERRSDAWCRLLATFRAVYGGIFHDTLQLPAYGGSLFDPDRFPFLEGRVKGTEWTETEADPLRINNRIALHLLEALQILQIRVAGGVEPRRLSFRALDIEQIGHVYEGLLDHTAVRATAPVLGLVGTRYQEPEIELAELERYRAEGEDKLLAFLKEQMGKSPAALKKLLNAEIEPREAQRLRTACNNDAGLFDRVLPFAGLIRKDTLDYPIVILADSVYVTEGVDRRQSGTHYTPRNLTEEIVQYTLEPLVYEGVAEGKPKEEWKLRSASELLQLKICDIAMGSGAFLVQTCRYLAGKLVEAWQQAEVEHPGQVVIAPDGTLSIARPEECPIPKEPEERLLVAQRIVADRCLYGVDKNPLAVEMAKLSLWLVTLAKGRPFTFLDHALKWGDSLLGITRAEQIEFLTLNPDQEANQLSIASETWKPILDEAIEKRHKLESFSTNVIQDLEEKERLFEEAERLIDRLRFVGDHLIGRALADAGKTANLLAEDLMVVSDRIKQELERKETEAESLEITALKASTERMINLGNPANQPPRKPFHWLLEFPEVFLQEDYCRGFDVIMSNPPFIPGTGITERLGQKYWNYIGSAFPRRKKAADLCSYFFIRSSEVLKSNGYFGLIATNKIAQGDTREVGLALLTEKGATIYRAISELTWAGSANVQISIVHICKTFWQASRILDGQKVANIDSFLLSAESLDTTSEPSRLVTNSGRALQGCFVQGIGFILTPFETEQLIARSQKNSEKLFPYLIGEDVNQRIDHSPSRWIVNFKEAKFDEVELYPDLLEILKERVYPERIQKDASKYPRMVNEWWKYFHTRLELYEMIKPLRRVLVRSRVSDKHMLVFSPTNYVFGDAVVVFGYENDSDFALLQSSIHEIWARKFASSMRTDMRYIPTACLETFPFPTSDPSDLSTQFPTLNMIGETYYTHRQSILLDRQEGLTKTYNRFHDRNETADDIAKLRSLHIEMDQAVAIAYGWQDLDLGHDFHPTKQGIRFTISETARREVLDRLLQLNHDRYAEEVAQGLHDKKGKKAKGKTSKKQPPKTDTNDEQLTLL